MGLKTCGLCKSARPSKLNSTFVCANKDFIKWVKDADENFKKRNSKAKFLNVQYEMAQTCSFFRKRQNKLNVKHSKNWFKNKNLCQKW
jgi:hypothetical protein